MTACVFFLIGAVKGRFVEQEWYRGGAEVLFVGGGAAFLSYVIGLTLRSTGVPAGS